MFAFNFSKKTSKIPFDLLVLISIMAIFPENSSLANDDNVKSQSDFRSTFYKLEMKSSLAKCLACHKNTSGLSVEVKKIETLQSLLGTMSKSLIDDMIERTKLSDIEAQRLREVIKVERNLRSIDSPAESKKTITNPASCYLPEEKRDLLLNNLPKMIQNNSTLIAALMKAVADKQLIFYDRTSVPLTLQGETNDDYGTGILRSEKNPSNFKALSEQNYFSDGAREFPWKSTAGIDVSNNGNAQKFIIASTQGPSVKLKSRTRLTDPKYFGRSTNVNGPQQGWEFKTDTIFGEILFVQNFRHAKSYPFEIRLRRKLLSGSWQFDVLRPFASPNELAASLISLCSSSAPPAGCKKIPTNLYSLIQTPKADYTLNSNFLNSNRMNTMRDPLSLNTSAIDVIQESANLHYLPELEPDVVTQLLLTTPFKSVFEKTWIGIDSWAPSTESTFHIVPQHYFAGLIPHTHDGCTKCHDSAGHHVDNFDPSPYQMFAPIAGDAIRPRTWYDFIPGDDNILSWHPFSPEAIRERKKVLDKNALNSCLLESNFISIE